MHKLSYAILLYLIVCHQAVAQDSQTNAAEVQPAPEESAAVLEEGPPSPEENPAVQEQSLSVQEQNPPTEKENPVPETGSGTPNENPSLPAEPEASPDPVDAAALAVLASRLDKQLENIETLQSALASQQALLDEQQSLITEQRLQIDQQQTVLQDMNAHLSQLEEITTTSLQDGDVLLTERLDTLEQRLNKEPEDPLKALEDDTFPGSWRIPGTNSAMRIGGYVKMNIVNSFDPLVSRDRFIVGTIPPTGQGVHGAEKGTTLTAQQSRVNLDLRDNTPRGMLRAFVEGDFAGDGETFRMRHAYGQFGPMLAGKTWSTLMNLSATPEEVDFEGINGRINVRQPQLRFFPGIGKNLNLKFSLEDPAPDITGGEGANTLWDIVASLNWDKSNLLHGPFSGWSIQTALIARQLKGRISDVEETKTTSGWGVVASGAIPFKRLNDNDQFLWQLIYGDGIGRYINDLGTIGGQDAVFSPDGELKSLPVFAGYLSYQHWWNERWRSNATFSWVAVDAYDFQSLPGYVEAFGDPYEQTLRASFNLIFNPVRRLELGTELLWGERQNANDTVGDAMQLQLSAKYYY